MSFAYLSKPPTDSPFARAHHLCLFALLKDQDKAKPIGGPTGEPLLLFATYQDPLVGEILQASVSGGVKDHREEFVRSLHVPKFHLVLGGERKRPYWFFKTG